MKNTQISYSVNPEKTGEHIDLIRGVFEELNRSHLTEVSYSCFQTGEHTFMHIAQFGSEAAHQAFTNLPSFKAFSKNSGDRIVNKPVSIDVKEIGDYKNKLA
ncbi:quinol monooxygenase YgiN [Chitinophaga sp. W2I13]|uniref:antibiotic biosynthesis monooxygenase n=1 Tax=Chitinophaga sp. W2I13 TaxID=3373923 RepID=UPI003D1EF8D2